jgi:hypothetical protein
MKLHDFLVEHAKFPFPRLDESRTIGTTDISPFEVGLLEREWKAGHAVRDDALVQKLCRTLKNILGDTPVAADEEHYIRSRFSPRLEVDERGLKDLDWDTNPNERQVRFFRFLPMPLTPQIDSVVIKQGIF